MKTALVLVSLVALAVAGCDKPKPQATGTPGTTPKPTATAAILPTNFFLAAEPAGAKPVDEVKKAAKAGEPIVIRGRVGGSHDPFVSGRAVFTIMSPSVPACSDNPDDHCKTPWDYCCESKDHIAIHSATIQVVDAAGAPLKLDVKGQNGVKELSDLIIVGKIAQSEGKVLLVNATGMYIAKK